MNHVEIFNLLIQLFILLIVGRLMAEVARRVNLPPLVGEIVAGILLGQTVFGMISPGAFEWLFPKEGDSALILDGFVHVAVVLLLFIAGLEVELSMVIQQRKQAFLTSTLGLVLPFAFGFAIPYVFADTFDFGEPDKTLLFAMFMGTSLSITALPVIARILMDMNLLRSKFGMLIISSAMINDLNGWLIFTLVLSMMGQGDEALGLWQTIGLTLGFAIFMLTLGKAMLNRLLPWINKHLAWPGGIITVTIALCFLGAAITERIGIHAIFGAFIVGVAFGDSEHFSDKAKEIIHQFINNIFSPLFFVSIGLHVNFIENFNLWIVLIVLVLAFSGKILGAGLGAYFGGFTKRQSLAIGFGMNARGAMEIILGLIALNVGLINAEVFVALVIMALITSITSGPFMKLFLNEKKTKTLT
ncbi:MAG: cation:proton antiporter [Cyclobacteriaceae bacterium]|nr:cation:proton antiporter [Cyclobacteriaceae bacterium]